MVPMPHPARDPDGLFQDQETLHPDPLFMGARSISDLGLLERVRHRINHWLEVREERQSGHIPTGSAGNDASQGSSVPGVRTVTGPEITG
jgi:hypothetical protein